MMRGLATYLSLVLLALFYPDCLAQKMRFENSNDRVDYLIITTEELSSSFEPLVHWKFRKGLSAEIITMEEIDSRYDDNTIQLKIKSCLFDYYTNRELKWALLGGDHDVVPIQGCYAKVGLGATDLIDESIPTDLFYACFEGRFDWNSNLNDKIGERYLDGLDLIPNIYVSRIPVQNQEQVKTFVKKTLDYELNPPVEGFFEKMLFAGVRSYTSWDGKSDNHHRSELLARQYVSSDWNGETSLFFDTGTDFATGESYHVTTTNLIEQISSGYGLIHFAGPGSSTLLKMETGRNFDLSDVEKLNNPISGLLLSTSSMANAFDLKDQCLSEAFLRNPDGGAVAFFGSSRYGFGNPDTSFALGPSMSFNAIFIQNLLGAGAENTDLSFGAISSRTKSEFIHNGGAGGSYHYLLYAINPMGDPELPIYTGDPGVFDNVRIYSFGNTLTINTGGVDGCQVCMTHPDLSDGYQEVIKNVGSHTFDNVPEAYYLSISKPGYIPYHFSSESLTQVEGSLDQNVRLYPNPVSDFLHVEVLYGTTGLEVYDLQGKQLIKMDIQQGVQRINLSDYPAGAYLLKLNGEGQSTWHRIIKQD